MNRLITLVAGLSLGMAATAQTPMFKVSQPRLVDADATMQMYHPVFSPDGKQLFVSGEDYTGLSIVDLDKNTVRKLTDMPGAGWCFAVSDDGASVAVRQIHADDLSMSLYTIDVTTGASKLVAPRIAHTNTVTMKKGTISWAQNEAITAMPVATRLSAPAKTPVAPAITVTEEDLKMVVYKGEERHVIDPILTAKGIDENYCWTSLSPNGERLLFVAGNLAYTCALDGSDLVELGMLHGPVWRGNDYIVGMEDADDGHFITEGKIVVIDSMAKNRQLLSPADSKDINLYPAVSPDGNQVAWHTLEGKIYIVDITKN